MMKPIFSSAAIPPSSVSKSPFVSLSNLFNCGCSSDVHFEPKETTHMYNQASYDDEDATKTDHRNEPILQMYLDSCNEPKQPMMYNQASYEVDETDKNEPIKMYYTACNTAEDDAFYYNHVVTNTPQTYTTTTTTVQEQPVQDYCHRRIQNLPIGSKMNGNFVPISPITSQQQRQQSISSSFNSSEATPVQSNRTMMITHKNKNQKIDNTKPRFEMLKLILPTRSRSTSAVEESLSSSSSVHPKLIKHTASDCTQSTHSMSDSEEDEHDDMSIESTSSCHDDETKPVVSILRRKEKLGPLSMNTSTRIIHSPKSQRRVRFVQGTKFSDPKALPHKRKSVPRLSPKQRQDYAFNAGWLTSAGQDRAYLQCCTSDDIDDDRNLKNNAGPSLTITTRSSSEEFRDDSVSPRNARHQTVDPEVRRLQRVERRMEQNQYHGKSSSKSKSSSSFAAEELLAQLNYNDSNGFYVFR